MNEASILREDKNFSGSMSFLAELDAKYDDKNLKLDHIEEEDEDGTPGKPKSKSNFNRLYNLMKVTSN